jgi:squalene-hopene/tetraprenyl-beta-curcumene cyclase
MPHSVRRTTFLVLVVLSVLLTAQAMQRGRAEPVPQAPVNKPTEPMADSLSLSRAGEFLDRATLAWADDHNCASCHTTYAYLMARPLLGDARAPALLQTRKFLEDRVANWDKGGEGAGLPEGTEGITEVVATATTLAFHDKQSTGKLHPLTRKALDRMWKLQRADGSWDWNKHQLPPQEFDDYYGVVFAAIGVGQAPEDYARSDAARKGVARLTRYLTHNPPPNLHHRTMLVWASLHLDGLMTPEQRKATIEELRTLQREDGGWNLPSLADWKRLNGKDNDRHAASDGYATGLVVYVLRQAGVAVDDPAIQRGVTWLKTHQRASGGWFTRSVNADRAHYISNAGTAYAVMALQACGVSGK